MGFFIQPVALNKLVKQMLFRCGTAVKAGSLVVAQNHCLLY
jgi:hypothetical protein